MLRSLKALGVSCALIIPALACQQQATEQSGAAEEDVATSADAAAIFDEKNTVFEQAMLAGDVEGMMADYTPDAVLQPPMMPANSGTESIRELFAGMVADGAPTSFDIVGDDVTVAESGELAYETGHYTAAGQINGETWETQGKYLAVWEKDADGEWKTAALSWSPNATPPAMEYAAQEVEAEAAQAEAAQKAATDTGTADPANAGETN